MYDPPLTLPLPKVINLLTDLKEERDGVRWINSWVVAPVTKIVDDFSESLKKYPLGDGVNDAPALALADVRIAIGAGTDVAVETADLVLVKNDSSNVAHSIQLARKVPGKIEQNLFWAAIYNVIAIPVASGIFYPRFRLLLRLEWSALTMNVSTLTVTLNALLFNRAPWRKKL